MWLRWFTNSRLESQKTGQKNNGIEVTNMKISPLGSHPDSDSASSQSSVRFVIQVSDTSKVSATLSEKVSGGFLRQIYYFTIVAQHNSK